MFLLINLLLLPLLIFGMILGYFHLFGGPLPAHYLYRLGPQTSTPPDGAGEEGSPSSSVMASSPIFKGKNNRSAGVVSFMHHTRIFLLGTNESSTQMKLFRQAQERCWRVYKLLIHRVFHTCELERMITESEITMVPMGNVMNEKVGFHPHLVSLSVRISAYLRSSHQLRSVLELEAESSAAELVASAATRSSPSSKDPSNAMLLEQPGPGDEDETPLSTPSLTPAFNAGRGGVMDEPPSLSLGPTQPQTPLKSTARAGLQIHTHAPRYSQASSSSSSAPPPSSQQQQKSSTDSLSFLPHPPALSLASSDESTSLALQDKRANHLLQLIVAIKGVSRTSGPAYSNLFRPVLYRALIYRNEFEDFLRFQLEPVLTIKYDSKNVQHEKWLLELWDLYRPLGPTKSQPSSRISKEWEELGFQGDNPASDFRGMGVLGLRNLMEFARICPIQSNLILKHSQEFGLQWFSFAITGINLTADIVTLCQNHTLDSYFYTYGSNWYTFHSLYATMFIKFDEFWCERRPPNVMSFGSVHAEFLTEFIAEAKTFPFSPRSLEKEKFHLSDVTPVTPRILPQEGAGGQSHDDDDDADDDFEISDVQHVTEGVVSSRRASKGSAWALSRSTSPFSVSGGSSALSHTSSPGSRNDSPGLHALSRSEFLESGGVLPLGSMLDPIVAPAMFARHPLPQWTT